jgi:uncharacterized repeat protein (TIGR01451 family)
MLGTAPAIAGIGGSVVPDFPAAVTVGQTFNATLTLTNNSDGGNLAESVSATGVFLFPSCQAGLGICTTPDPGVFTLSATGTGTAGSCVGDTFTIAESNPATGEWSFTRNGGPFVLGPANNAATKFCTITYQATVLKLPTLDSNAGLTGLQTLQIARVNTLQGLTTGNTGQAAGSDETTVQRPVLQIQKTPDGGNITAGQNAVFTIVLTNNGPGTATGVQINDALPAGFTWSVSQQPAQGMCSVTGGTALNCAIGDLAQGASVTVQVSAPTSVQACGPINNTTNGGAIGTATNADQVSDPGTILCVIPPHLVVVKTPDNGTYNPGDTVNFTVVVTNDGGSNATNVVLNDPLPVPAGSSLAWGPANPVPMCTGQSGGTPTCTVAANVLSCNYFTLAPTGSCTVTVSSATNPANPADCASPPGLLNTATATGDGGLQGSDTGSQSCEQVGEGICRTPGFWGTHACGTSGSLDPAQCEKVRGDTTRARNITQLALDLAIDKAGGTLTICGEPISNTQLGSDESALEAICVKPSTNQSKPLQVARQLTSAVLNCAITNTNLNDALCEGTSNNDLFNACNTACAAATDKNVTATVSGFQVSCGEALDCLNNGFVFHLDTGVCGPETTGCHDESLTNVGACTISGDLCSSNDPCAPGAGECKPGPAGSSKACNAAHDNNCTIFGGC